MIAEPQVLYGDDALVVIEKPVGMPSQPDPSQALSVVEWVERSMPEFNVFVVQRLDRPASGVMAVAVGDYAARSLSEAFRSRRVSKTYLALIEWSGKLPQEGTLKHYLVRDGRNNISKTVAPDDPHGKEAILKYKVLQIGRTRACVVVDLETGRHHQIRAQFAAEGCPLAGDVKYGASSALRAGGIALHAFRLVVPHPISGKRLVFESRPSGKAWEPFLESVPKDIYVDNGCFRPPESGIIP